MPELASWSIFFLPLASFIAIAALRPFTGPNWRGAGYITVAALAAAFVLSLIALARVAGADSHNLGYPAHDWLEIGPLTLRVGIVMDSLTAIMAVVVTGVSLLVQFYGQEYMRGDRSYVRYYAYMSLFTASMLGLVMASNLVLLFVFWELVGVCSYLLIGYWSFGKGAEEHPAAANAAKKAFLVTRLGDVGFLAAIAWAYTHTGTVEIGELTHMVEAGILGGAALTWLCLGIFAGAAGKSGQFPLHVWLPDAMEGPTPVSALIHAATMVAAGVFLVARLFPLFEASQGAMTTVAWIGGCTAAFAATMALVSNDVKRVMAYSTVSQLGYMMLALGMGAIGPAIFHLFTHAFFKALLFLGAGSIHHAVHTYDMRFMGGLGRRMPWTRNTMLIAGLALVGVFPRAGFWSKDGVLGAAFSNDVIAGAPILYIIAVVTAGLTGFYVFRMLFMTFGGEFRGGAAAEAKAIGQPVHAASHDPHAAGVHAAAPHESPHAAMPHESPWIIIAPMTILAAAAAFAGLANLPWDVAGISAEPVTHFLGGHAEEFSVGVAALSSAVGASGIVLAWLMYVQGAISPVAMGKTFRPIYVVLANRYYLDCLYERVITGKLLLGLVAGVAEMIDTHIIDRTVNLAGWISRNLGRVPATLQNGQAQAYGAVISLGLVLMLGAFWIWG